MLIEQTFEKLNAMKLYGMAQGLAEQLEMAAYAPLSFEERVGMLVDREWGAREERRLQRRLKRARLKQPACLEDIDYQASRGLDASVMRSLASCRWVVAHANVLVTGPCGVGKTYISCALANQAMRRGYSALYFRAPRLFHSIYLARADGSYLRFMAKLEKSDLLVIDDFGLAPLGEAERRELLELVEDRQGSGSLILASQLPVSAWHEVIGEPTIADAILDRIVHNAHRIELKGPSLRRRMAKPEPEEH
jgi:DNA replication protein DnaC